MKAFLMYRDRDLDLATPLPPGHEALAQDLELDTLCTAMAGEDKFLYEVAEHTLLTGTTDPDTIGYRQRILADCLANPTTVGQLYCLAVEAIQREKREYFGIFRDPETVVRRSVRVLEIFVDVLKRLRATVEESAAEFRSEGCTRLFTMLSTELDDDYFAEVDWHLAELRLNHGVLTSAVLGKGAKGAHHVLRERRRRGWRDRLPFGGEPSYSFLVPARDEAGFRALAELNSRGMNLVANAVGQSAEHILSFFRMLRAELAFYIGCLNLHQRLSDVGSPICFPEPTTAARSALSARDLYDPCLALRVGERVVGNDVDATGRSLVMVTGANQGGKSTFLRSVGLAQLMTQAGMFGPAAALTVPVYRGVFTHFKREEDATMESGKLDEELARMSEIADHITTGCLLLCNESFAATNEREGSEIARQVVRALTDAGIVVLFVTHLFDLAHGLYRQHSDSMLFLRAERRPDGTRTLRVVPAEPLPTSYGEDSYRRIFETTAVPTRAGPR